MKKILILCKLVNYWTNNEITAKEEADQILKFMLLKSNTKRFIEVFCELEKLVENEATKRALDARETNSLICNKWGVKSCLKDPNFNKKLTEIEIKYESK